MNFSKILGITLMESFPSFRKPTLRSAPEAAIVDKRALKILFDTFWSSAGWKPEGSRGISLEEFAYAKSKGMMFDPVLVEHDAAQSQLLSLVAKIDRRRVANAFLSSLSTRRLDWRSALGSYAVFQHMPPHAEVRVDDRCAVCGMYSGPHEEDLSVLNFERHKWGGVRHDQVPYAALDLSLFIKEDVPVPTAEDVGILRGVIYKIREAPENTSSSNLQSVLSTLFKSNKAERDVLISLLGFCGILGTAQHPGYSERYIHPFERHLPDRRFVDMSYPACWWKISDGINEHKIGEYFGHVI